MQSHTLIHRLAARLNATSRGIRNAVVALAVLLASAGLLSAAPTITATQDDGVPAATRKLVNDTVNYTTIISNTAPIVAGNANDATGVMLTNATPLNTTDTGTVTISPIAFDDMLIPQRKAHL